MIVLLIAMPIWVPKYVVSFCWHGYVVAHALHNQFDLSLFINNWAASWQNQQNGMCTQRRIRSAWASDQSDQSLRCPHMKKDWVLSYPNERTAKTLIRLKSSLGAQSFCSFCHEAAHLIIERSRTLRDVKQMLLRKCFDFWSLVKCFIILPGALQ